MPPKASLKQRNELYQKNITKRGKVSLGAQAKEKAASVGPYVLAFFLFVVVGSSLLQIFKFGW